MSRDSMLPLCGYNLKLWPDMGRVTPSRQIVPVDSVQQNTEVFTSLINVWASTSSVGLNCNRGWTFVRDFNNWLSTVLQLSYCQRQFKYPNK